MAETPESRYCPGCGVETTETVAVFCKKCQARLDRGAGLSLLLSVNDGDLFRALKSFLDDVSADSLAAMTQAIHNGDTNTAAIECGVWENSHSLIYLINDELSWVSTVTVDKPKGEKSL